LGDIRNSAISPSVSSATSSVGGTEENQKIGGAQVIRVGANYIRNSTIPPDIIFLILGVTSTFKATMLKKDI
jgi:hypothetical protein